MTERVEREGKKWIVSHKTSGSVKLDDVNPKQSIFIDKCEDCEVIVDGEVNNITINDCNRVIVQFTHVATGLSIMHSKKTTTKVFGKLPSLTIDNSHGSRIILNQESADVVIFTSTSSETNVILPPPEEGADALEFRIAEQLKTTFAAGKKTTVPVEME
eukprot:TRINITY_DN865_c0_g1_i1.p1 TRINITY_DN865_c0_g1~~TRINITY_DN865_c0_g1_i1.p1  ORF type:complete len:159 (-),score=33.82 TRINITY_DN865_c0_g1_i1:29-505(-)